MEDYVAKRKIQDERRDSQDYFERDDPSVILETTNMLSQKEKLAYFSDPNYCFVIKKDNMRIMRQSLDNLTHSGGVFYSVYDRDNSTDEAIVLVYFDDIMLDLMGELLEVQCRLSIHDLNTEFKCYAADLYEQFNSRQTQYIILKTFETEFDIGYLTKTGVIIDHFPCHTQDREYIIKSWRKHGFKLTYSIFLPSFWSHMQPINFIADYYGEEYGFYFAWLVHYTGMLLLPALFGLVIFLIQFAVYMKDGGNFWEGWDAFNSKYNTIYAIFIAIWAVFYVESWKRT